VELPAVIPKDLDELDNRVREAIALHLESEGEKPSTPEFVALKKIHLNGRRKPVPPTRARDAVKGAHLFYEAFRWSQNNGSHRSRRR